MKDEERRRGKKDFLSVSTSSENTINIHIHAAKAKFTEGSIFSRRSVFLGEHPRSQPTKHHQTARASRAGRSEILFRVLLLATIQLKWTIFFFLFSFSSSYLSQAPKPCQKSKSREKPRKKKSDFSRVSGGLHEERKSPRSPENYNLITKNQTDVELERKSAELNAIIPLHFGGDREGSLATKDRKRNIFPHGRCFELINATNFQLVFMSGRGWFTRAAGLMSRFLSFEKLMLHQHTSRHADNNSINHASALMPENDGGELAQESSTRLRVVEDREREENFLTKYQVFQIHHVSTERSNLNPDEERCWAVEACGSLVSGELPLMRRATKLLKCHTTSTIPAVSARRKLGFVVSTNFFFLSSRSRFSWAWRSRQRRWGRAAQTPRIRYKNGLWPARSFLLTLGLWLAADLLLWRLLHRIM